MPIRSSSRARAQICGSGPGDNVGPTGNKGPSNFELILRRSLRARRNTFAQFARVQETFQRQVALLRVLPPLVLEVAPVSRLAVVVDLETHSSSVRGATVLLIQVNIQFVTSVLRPYH